MNANPHFDSITALLTDYMDVQGRRAELVAGNLANADTPGYKAMELDFSDFLERAAADALSSGRAASMALADAPTVVEQESSSPGLDGNTVDAAREAATLAEIGVRHLAGAQLIQSRFRTLRAAIREGR